MLPLKKTQVNFGTGLYYSLNEFRYADLTNFQIPLSKYSVICKK